MHALHEQGEVVSEAICGHCAPTSRFIEPLPDAKKCLACLLIHGDQLANQHEERPRWS